MRGIRVTAFALLAATAAIAGCGSSTHENEPRPPVPTVVSISVGKDTIDAKAAIGRGVGEPGPRQPYLNQNRTAPQNQADRKAPAVVNFAIANLTDRATVLRMQGEVSRTVALTPGGSGSFMMALPTGIYRFSSPASSDTALLNVGPSRVSSGGDLLLP
ncbi:MAG TPA: hypothetical protein PKA56_08930 [Solirubrobacterales bacterium]|nr:hypothetical protein [Solirubrobacterales bacterium]HMU26153.1 hypothetical protein [Solirubrobacterales bacterium]HMW46394.1 hypothetical protein [Solirubrobacterales bacterium]HMX71866.1 hypothetical protein [Solirubrobacterales bacterium]HMY25931.1 hypothetical protein [Solirubrobacterales bacterium]